MATSVTRRTFLSRSARAAALAPVLATRQAWSANDRLGMAVIGLRGIGNSHLKRILARPDADCLAVCDVDQEFRQRAAETVKQATGRKPRVVSDFRHLLDDDAIDAVVIATPHHWHAPIAVRALRAGKDLYLEKPRQPRVPGGDECWPIPPRNTAASCSTAPRCARAR